MGHFQFVDKKGTSMYHHIRPLIGPVFALLAVAALFGDGVSSKSKSSTVHPVLRSPGPDSTAFELAPQKFDPTAPPSEANCLLLNPQWRWQIDHPVTNGKPTLDNFPDSLDVNQCNKDFNCVGEQCEPAQANCKPNKDLPPVLCPTCYLGQNNRERIHGHYNWFPATYTGTVCFNDYSFPDLDYTFSLIPEPDTHAFPGLTRWNPPAEPDPKKGKKCGPGHDQACGKPCGQDSGKECTPKAFHIEFDSLETIERFQSPHWSDFRDLASPCKNNPVKIKSCDQDKARDFVKKKRAVVIGLLGLDSEHNIYSELHPVYAIAIEINDNPKNNTWMVFARNNGDEGACAINLHPLFGPDDTKNPLDKVLLLIPPPKGQTVSGASLGSDTIFYSSNSSSSQTAAYVDKLFVNSAGPDFTNHNQGLLVTFDLRSCGDGCTPLVEGELHIDWTVVKVEEGFAKATPDACINPDELERDEKAKFREPSITQANQLTQMIVEARLDGAASMNKAPFVVEKLGPRAPCTKLVDKIRPENRAANVLGGKIKTTNIQRIQDILNRP